MRQIIRILLFAALAISFAFCSTTRHNTIPNDAPPPTYIYPPDNSTGQSRNPTFIWNHYRYADQGVNHYLIYLRSGPGDDAMILDEVAVYDSFYVCPLTLEEDTEYEWMIYAIDQHDDASIGLWWQFTTGSGFNNPPVAPFDPDPEDGSTGVFLIATLDWDCYDFDDDPLTYDLWFKDLYGDSTLVADGIAGPPFDPDDLEPDRRYYWKVVAHDDQGGSTPGPWWVFKTMTALNRPPVEPWVLFPDDDATTVPLDVALDWGCSDPEDDPITYDVAMGLAGGTLTVIGSDLAESSLEVTGLDPLTEYEWQVSATDDHYQTTPGPIWSFTTGDGSPQVFAAMRLWRNITYSSGVIRNDYIQARFDSVYAPDGPIYPLRPGAVSCNSFDLVWQSFSDQYAYSDYIAGYFLNPGGLYTFTVTAGDGVPDLTTFPIALQTCQPYITSPEPFATVSMDGFDLEWHTFCSGTIDITIMDLNADSTGVYIRTEDDGEYTFTSDDLAPISPMAYQLMIVLIREEKQYITAPGYDARSWVWSRTLSTQYVSLSAE
ncbi:MAG: hypothetical protein JW814_02870 [Candidatus Krumholzibacteriota bacterium]|nr:hypothetical protein [Candidatus Krumholzibacteriota bacterium]